MKTVLSEYTKNRDNNFNLMRFIAALLVLYTHSFLLVGSIDPLLSIIKMTWGNIAVDIFFVMSGFLIASSFFTRNNIVAFIWSRALRIYPALFFSIVFCTFIVGLIFTTNTTIEYLTNSDTYKYFFKNIILFFGIEHNLPGVFADLPYKDRVNGSLWTLPNEVKMYILLTVVSLILVNIRKWLGYDLIKMTFLCIAFIAVATNIVNYFYGIFPFYFVHFFSMFFVGSAFYLCREHIWFSSRAFILILIILLLSVFYKNLFFIVYIVSLPYLIFYIAYVPSGKIRRFNNMGDYSYAIYIYAFPVQQSIVALIPDVSVITMMLLSFIITFALAFLSWHLIEKKALKMKGYYIVFERILRRYLPNRIN